MTELVHVEEENHRISPVHSVVDNRFYNALEESGKRLFSLIGAGDLNMPTSDFFGFITISAESGPNRATGEMVGDVSIGANLHEREASAICPTCPVTSCNKIALGRITSIKLEKFEDAVIFVARAKCVKRKSS